MIISLDIYNNKIVRLYKGNEKKKIFFGYYNEYINYYETIKVKKIHIVLLDNIFKNIKKKINKLKIKIQLGGGLRKIKDLNFYKNKVYSYVLGSVILNKKEFKKIFSFFKKKILISIDCLNNNFVINGWLNQSKFTFEKICYYLININIKKIIYTNINKDGTMEGINYNEISFLKNKSFLCNFILSGGIYDIENIFVLKKKINLSFIIGISIYKFIIKISNFL